MLEICFSASQNSYSKKTTLNVGKGVSAEQGVAEILQLNLFSMMSQDLLARIVALKVETEKTWKFFAN